MYIKLNLYQTRELKAAIFRNTYTVFASHNISICSVHTYGVYVRGYYILGRRSERELPDVVGLFVHSGFFPVLSLYEYM